MRLDGFGRFRKCLVIFGFGLKILMFFGGFRKCLEVFGGFRMYSDVSGCVRTFSEIFGKFRGFSEFYGHVHTSFGPGWPRRKEKYYLRNVLREAINRGCESLSQKVAISKRPLGGGYAPPQTPAQDSRFADTRTDVEGVRRGPTPTA